MKQLARSWGKNRVFMFIGGCAATEELHTLPPRIGNLVVGTGWNGNGVALPDLAFLFTDLHGARAFEDVVELLGLHVMVACRGSSGGKPCLRQRLVLDARVAVGQKFADLGTVFRGERLHVFNVDNVQTVLLVLESVENVPSDRGSGVAISELRLCNRVKTGLVFPADGNYCRGVLS